MKRKNLTVEVQESTKKGGRVLISTGALDRMADRVLPLGANVENYLKNPVVQWGHNYGDPWATIGKTTALEVTEFGIVASFEFREPANENDPLNIIRALWDQGMINAASIGFNPTEYKDNADGGYDFTGWELLEWSLVPIPANQEALRLSMKALELDTEQIKQELQPPTADTPPESKADNIKQGPGMDEVLTAFEDALNNLRSML